MTGEPHADVPIGPVEVPALVRAVARSEPAAVWRNEAGGLTFRDGDRFLKWNPVGTGIDLEPERARLVWARLWHPVPEVLDLVRDDAGQLLVTAALPGDGAVTPGWRARPRDAVRAIGLGLRLLHEALPVVECPFGSPEWLVGRAVPPADVLVVCHGDACAPNTIIGADGIPVGHVDLGALGVADRWADLAIASMSLAWNYAPTWEDEFWAAYGVTPDDDRIRAYRALWDDDAPGL